MGFLGCMGTRFLRFHWEHRIHLYFLVVKSNYPHYLAFTVYVNNISDFYDMMTIFADHRRFLSF